MKKINNQSFHNAVASIATVTIGSFNATFSTAYFDNILVYVHNEL
ncbi:hypothetical protein [Paenibacillus cymbidii]|nr:hypothetical protein [Paenibacillus cymbidii]